MLIFCANLWEVGAPWVYTSYDYSAPLRETRQIQDKLSQTKLVGLFTRVSKDLLVTEMIGNGTAYAVGYSPFSSSKLIADILRLILRIFGHGKFATLIPMLDFTLSCRLIPVRLHL